jgi:cold shock CspA family protein
MRGEMLWFNETRDHGFIRTDEGERLAVAGEGFAPGERPEGRCAQRPVTFEITRTNGSRQARDVAFVPDVVARKPRMRGRGRG